MHDEESEYMKIRHECNAFADRRCQLSSSSELYVVCGGYKAGKSITVDLLSGKKLMKYDDVELGTAVIVDQSNCEQLYPPIYFRCHSSRMAMQSFTLSECQQNNEYQLLKLIYLEELIRVVGRLNFIVVCDEATIGHSQELLEHFLHCLGITSQEIDENIDIIKEYVYLLVTKTEVGRFEDATQTLEDIRKETSNQNIAEIIRLVIHDQKIAEFPIQQPTQQFADNIIQHFSFRNNRQQLQKILKRTTLRGQQAKQQHLLSPNSELQIIDLYCNVAQLVINLVLFSVDKKGQFRRQYENIAKSIFSTHKRKNEIEKMAEGWSLAQLNEATKIAQSSSQHENYMKVTSALLSILDSLEKSASEARGDFTEIIGMIIFCSSFADWMQQSCFTDKLQPLLTGLSQIQQQKHKLCPAEPQAPPALLPSASRRRANPYSTFKDHIQSSCQSNKAAIQICIGIIKKKEESANYDYYEVIYYIKLLRNLLEYLNNQEIDNHYQYINELLQISLYSENYFDFNHYLHIALCCRLLKESTTFTLITTLLQLNRIEECKVIIQYAQAFVTNSQQYTHLGKLKKIIHKRSNQHYEKQREESGGAARAKRLSLTIEGIEQKSSVDARIKQKLSECTFRRYLS